VKQAAEERLTTFKTGEALKSCGAKSSAVPQASRSSSARSSQRPKPCAVKTARGSSAPPPASKPPGFKADEPGDPASNPNEPSNDILPCESVPKKAVSPHYAKLQERMTNIFGPVRAAGSVPKSVPVDPMPWKVKFGAIEKAPGLEEHVSSGSSSSSQQPKFKQPPEVPSKST